MLPVSFYVVHYIFQTLYTLLVIRVILDIFFIANQRFQPRGILLILSEIVLTVTDWMLKPVRRFVKPIRIGGVGIDLSFTIAWVLLVILEQFVTQIAINL